jgi:hypothetical protein
MIHATMRPLPSWPHGDTYPRRRRPFSASWSSTLELLDRELRHLDGERVIIAAGFREEDLRLDGWPRSGARDPAHPGVEISFDSRHGRLVYATDVCDRWEDNVRAIGLGLEALRAVDRHGVSRRGQQYAGWRALPSGGGVATVADAWRFLVDADGGGLNLWGEWPPKSVDALDRVYRSAARNTHPDTPDGSAERFVQVKAAFDFLKAQR